MAIASIYPRNDFVETAALGSVSSRYGGGIIAGLYVNAVITGFGWPVGVRQSFRSIVIPVRAYSASKLPRSAYIAVRETSSTGTLLASTRVGLACNDTSTDALIVADFGQVIANSGGASLWVEVETDAVTNFYVGGYDYTVASGYPAARYSLAGNPASPAWTSVSGAQYIMWTEFYGDTTGTAYTPNAISGRGTADILRTSLSVMPGMKMETSVGWPGAWVSSASASTFSGWGCYVGNIATAFDAVGFQIYPYDGSNMPSSLVCRVRRMPSDAGTWDTSDVALWEIIAQSSLLRLSDLTEDTFKHIVVALDRAVSGQCWVEVQSNGYLGLGMAASTLYPTISRYRTSKIITPAMLQYTTTAKTFAIALGIADWSQAATVASASGATATLTPSVTIHLPTNAQNAIRCLEGIETTIYWKNVIRATSADGTVLNSDDLFINVTCTKGMQLERGWRYTPTSGDAGSTTLTITVYDQTGTTAYATAVCTLVTVALSHPTSAVSRKLVVIGDSTINNGSMLAELVNLFDGDAKYTLTLTGTNNGNADDADSVSRAVSSESVSGWTFALFDTDTATAWTELGGTARAGSVFENAGAFDFAHYLSAESITLAAGDWVIINLGINDMFGYTTDATAQAAAMATSATLVRWITSIKAAVSGIRIGICLVIPPATQDGFGTGYGNGQTYIQYMRNRSFLIEALLSAHDTAVASNVYIIPINATLDALYNFPVTAVAVNARSTTTMDQYAGSVHPAASGYWQIADTYRAFLKAVEA